MYSSLYICKNSRWRSLKALNPEGLIWRLQIQESSTEMKGYLSLHFTQAEHVPPKQNKLKERVLEKQNVAPANKPAKTPGKKSLRAMRRTRKIRFQQIKRGRFQKTEKCSVRSNIAKRWEVASRPNKEVGSMTQATTFTSKIRDLRTSRKKV